jgi:hypothetical protein
MCVLHLSFSSILCFADKYYLRLESSSNVLWTQRETLTKSFSSFANPTLMFYSEIGLEV